MIVFGHRGAAGYKLENSKESFIHALSLGVSAIECDVRLVGETFYLFHDRNTERVAARKIDLIEAKEADLKECCLKNGERPLTLEDALEITRGRALLNVELKSAGAGAQLARYIKGIFEKTGGQEIIVSSFSEIELESFSLLAPNVPIAFLIYGTRVNWDFSWCSYGLSTINISYDFLSADFIATLKPLGKKILCYTVNTEKEVLRCLGLGVDGIFTDFPDIAFSALGGLGHNGLTFLG